MRRVIIASSLFVLSACPEPPPTGPVRDLSVAATRPAPRVPLVPLALATHADFDALEERIVGRREVTPLITALERLAQSARPAERAEDALLLMRLGALYRDQDEALRNAGRESGYLEKALAIGTRLRAEAPTSPHTLFYQGWVPFAFLGGRVDRPLSLTPETKELASACRDQWRALLATAPDYDGPGALDAAAIARIIAQVDAAEAELVASTATAAEPTPAEVVDRGDVEVINTLARFESASEGERKTICRDWEASRKRAGQGPRSVLALRMDLACATTAGQAGDAIGLISELRRRDGPAFDACLAVARLGDRADLSRLDKTLQEADLLCGRAP